MAELNDQDFLEIESYIRKELPSEQAVSFEKKLLDNPAFAKAYKVEKDIHDSISFVEQQKLKGRLNKIHEDIFPENQAIERKITSSRRRWAPLAAAVLVGVIIAAFFLFPQGQSSQQLMADFYEKPSFAPERGVSDFADIQKAYQEDDFQQTITLISQSDNPSLQLYKGIAHLELGEYDDAQSIFSSLQANTNINDQATWYLALTFLKMDDKEASKKELEKLINDTISTTNTRKEQAQELYQKL